MTTRPPSAASGRPRRPQRTYRSRQQPIATWPLWWAYVTDDDGVIWWFDRINHLSTDRNEIEPLYGTPLRDKKNNDLPRYGVPRLPWPTWVWLMERFGKEIDVAWEQAPRDYYENRV